MNWIEAPKRKRGRISGGGSEFVFFQLYAPDQKLFELVKAANGKVAVVSGDLIVVPILEDVPFSSPPNKREAGHRLIIRIVEIKIDDAKDAAPPKK